MQFRCHEMARRPRDVRTMRDADLFHCHAPGHAERIDRSCNSTRWTTHRIFNHHKQCPTDCHGHQRSPTAAHLINMVLTRPSCPNVRTRRRNATLGWKEDMTIYRWLLLIVASTSQRVALPSLDVFSSGDSIAAGGSPRMDAGFG